MAQRYRIEVEVSRDAPRPLLVSVDEGGPGAARLELGPTGVARLLTPAGPGSDASDQWIAVDGGRFRVVPAGEALVSNIANSGWAAPELEVCLAGVLTGRGQRYPLPRNEGEEVVVGRSAGAGVDVPVDDPHVSRKHLAIVRREDAYIVTSHGTHGSFLNDRQLTEPTRLTHNDTLRIGTARVVFRSYDQLLLATEQGASTPPPPSPPDPTPHAATPHPPLPAKPRAAWVGVVLGVAGILLLLLVVLGVRIAMGK